MLGILLIAMENGSSVKTYGVSCSGIYNMKRAFLWLLVLVSFSGCAIAEIEFYPGFRRPDRASESKWAKVPEETDNENSRVLDLAKLLHDYRRTFPGTPLSLEQLYNFRREQQRLENSPYVPLPTEGRRQHVDPDFAYRIPENVRIPQDSAPLMSETKNNRINPQEYYDQDPEFTFRIPTRVQLQQDDEPILRRSNLDDDYNSIRGPADSSASDSDFTFHDQPNFEPEDRSEEQQQQQQQSKQRQLIAKEEEHVFHAGHGEHDEHEVHEDNTEDKQGQDQNSAKKTFNISDEPGLFAYPPSDPRYYEDAPTVSEELNKERYNDEEPDGKQDNIAVQPRQDISESGGGRVGGMSSMSAGGGRGVLTMEELQREIDRSVQMMPMQHHLNPDETAGVYIIAVVAGISAAATVGLIAFGIGWYNLQKHVKNAADVEYPAYGVTGPNKEVSPSGDRRLAQSAQMYHYQHQKQQIIAMESRAATGDGRHGSLSEAESDEENEEGDYTVYECPGLAPTGEMEVKNPLFQDDPTPAATKNGGNTNVK